MHPERWTFDWFYKRQATMTDNLKADGSEKRAKTEVRYVTVDLLPTTAQVWDMLRRAYGTKLVGATLVAVIDNDGTCTVQTLTFPGPNGA